MWLATLGITNSFLLIGIFQTLLGPIFPPIWPILGPGWAILSHVDPLFHVCWIKLWIDACSPLWPPAAAQPQILDPPAHKRVQYLMKFLAFFQCFFHIFYFPQHHHFFSPGLQKPTRPQTWPTEAPNVPKIGRPNRRSMPKIRPESANTGQDEPRIQPITCQTYPKIYENISIRISKTGNPIQKLNSNADNAKEPHNNISKTLIFPVFSAFFAMPANVTSRP